ncbi:MAG: lysophospholipid acyltransferase family protein, partial [Anaerolineales bacterium]
MIRRFLRWAIRLIFTLLSNVRAIGLENVPREGGILLATNHLSRIDPPLIFYLVPRDDTTALVADSYRKNPLLRLLVNALGGIWINRQGADFSALRTARAHLQAGRMLGVAPEGTRSHTRALIPAKTGIAYLADKASVPVLPAAIHGTETAFEMLFRLRRPQITLQFGQPFTLPPIDRRHREACLQRNTDEIMCHIAAMLPPQYWGTYAGHPRLEELLADPQSPLPEC